MIKTVKKEIIEVKEVVTDVLCNQCSSSLKDTGGMNYEGLVEVGFTGGFYSKLGDMNSYKFSLCEDCLSELFDKFKINALVEEGTLIEY